MWSRGQLLNVTWYLQLTIHSLTEHYGYYFTVINNNYNNFIGHFGVFCELKCRIQRAKIYFSPLLCASKKEENNVASQSELEAISTVRAVFLLV